MIKPGTEEWIQARMGRITGSEIHEVMGSEVTRMNYLGKLVTEILTGEAHTFSSYATAYGLKHEPDLIKRYVLEHAPVEEAQFITFGDYLGCTPDGFVGEEGIIEGKTRVQPIKHIMCFVVRHTKSEHKSFVYGVPTENYPQIQFNLWVCGRSWCDFVSYCPAVPRPKQLFVQRVYIDIPYLEGMEQKLLSFIRMLESILEVMLDY